MRNNNHPERRRSTLFRKNNGTFRSTFERMKSFTTSTRIPFPDIIELDEIAESGRSPAASP